MFVPLLRSQANSPRSSRSRMLRQSNGPARRIGGANPAAYPAHLPFRPIPRGARSPRDLRLGPVDSYPTFDNDSRHRFIHGLTLPSGSCLPGVKDRRQISTISPAVAQTWHLLKNLFFGSDSLSHHQVFCGNMCSVRFKKLMR